MVSLGSFAGGLGGSLQAGFAARERERLQGEQIGEQRKTRQTADRRARQKSIREGEGAISAALTGVIDKFISNPDTAALTPEKLFQMKETFRTLIIDTVDIVRRRTEIQGGTPTLLTAPLLKRLDAGSPLISPSEREQRDITRAGAIAGSEQQAKQDVGPIQEPQLAGVNMLLPDGTRASGRIARDGTFEVKGADGQFTPAPPGTIKVSVESTPSGLPDSALRNKIIGLRASANNFVSQSRKTIQRLNDPKLVLGVAGSTIRFLQGVGAQARQLATAFGAEHQDGTTGKDISLAQLLDPARYNFDGLQAIAAASTQVKSDAIALAYMLARSRDPNGRLSDFDVQSALDSLGFASTDKKIVAAVLLSRMDEVVSNVNNFIVAAGGQAETIQGIGGSTPQSGGAQAVDPKDPLGLFR